MSSPGAPQGNPSLIIIDTSAVLQLVATDQLTVLRSLRSDFDVQSAIVHAVESEVLYALENVSKFRGRQEQFKKALTNNSLAIVDRELLAPLFRANVSSWIQQMESEGERLYLIVDRGEAFSHAASMILNVPIATNDTTAVYKLLRNNEAVPRPILRFWDLIVFGHQLTLLDVSECATIRQTVRRREKVGATAPFTVAAR